ncbi:MAG: hypothetical protein IH845_05865 [Nanoarchaeota archaeon]|nr:hypothetical protein [Nanoarchaeota archaeon]
MSKPRISKSLGLIGRLGLLGLFSSTTPNNSLTLDYKLTCKYPRECVERVFHKISYDNYVANFNVLKLPDGYGIIELYCKDKNKKHKKYIEVLVYTPSEKYKDFKITFIPSDKDELICTKNP